MAEEGKKEGFNAWILGVKKGDKHAERRENLAQNMIALQRHAYMN